MYTLLISYLNKKYNFHQIRNDQLTWAAIHIHLSSVLLLQFTFGVYFPSKYISGQTSETTYIEWNSSWAMKEQPASTETALWDMQWLVIFSIDAENILFWAYIALGIHNVKINSQHGQTTPVVSTLKLWFYRHSAAKQKISGHLSARYVRVSLRWSRMVYFSQSEETAMWSEERHRWRGRMLETTALNLPAGNYRRLTAKTHTQKEKDKAKTALKRSHFQLTFVQKENIYSLLWHYLLCNFEYNDSDLRLLSIKQAL